MEIGFLSMWPLGQGQYFYSLEQDFHVYITVVDVNKALLHAKCLSLKKRIIVVGI
jgi:hypothetical protein